MKKSHFTLSILVSLFLILNTSCNNDGDDGNDGISIGEDCTASWTLDGMNFSEDLASCIYLDNTLNLSTNLTAGSFSLQINPISGPMNIVTDPTDQAIDAVIIITLDDGTRIGNLPGTRIDVTELSNSKAKGTFSGEFYDFIDFTLTPKYTITNGKFEGNF